MKKGTVVSVGIVAALAAVVILVIMMSERQGHNPYLVQLEQDMAVYTSQIDSMNVVIGTLNERIDFIRTQKDSAHTSNKVLLASLRNVTREMKEYRQLYNEQRKLNKQLRSQLVQVQAEKKEAVAELEELRGGLAKKDEELVDRETRIKRLEASLQESQEREAESVDALSQVWVYTGLRQGLEEAGYLQIRQKTIFTNEYKRIGFPNEMDDEVAKVSIGVPIAIQGEIQFLADRHGKLKRKKEYSLEKQGDGSYVLVFLDPLLVGQRVLVVLK